MTELDSLLLVGFFRFQFLVYIFILWLRSATLGWPVSTPRVTTDVGKLGSSEVVEENGESPRN